MTSAGKTRAADTLVEKGKRDLVLNVRRRFQQVMREDLVAPVEDATDRRVIAFMSDQPSTPTWPPRPSC